MLHDKGMLPKSEIAFPVNVKSRLYEAGTALYHCAGNVQSSSISILHHI